jgi:hypothetical protein
MRVALIVFCLAWQSIGQEPGALYFDPLYQDKGRGLAHVPEIFTAIDKAPLATAKASSIIALKGRYYLQAPKAGMLLRLRLKQVKHLALDFPGKPGLRISLLDKRQLQARRASWPGPKLGPCLASDGNNWIRLLGGVLDIRFQQGTLVLAQDDLVLLTAPLAQMPPQLQLDVQSKLYTAHFVPCTPLPLPSFDPQLLPPESPPENWTLTDHYEQGALATDGDSITLTRVEVKHSIQATAEIAAEGGCVITVPVESATVGAGIQLRSSQGKPYQFSVGEYQGERVLCEKPARKDNVRLYHMRGWIVGDTFSVRMIVGANLSAAYFSNDGMHWTAFDNEFIRRNDRKVQANQLHLTFADRHAGHIRIGPPEVRRWHGALEALAEEMGFSTFDLRHEVVVHRADKLFHGAMEAAKRGVELDRLLPALRELPWLVAPWADGQVSGEGTWWALWELYERAAERASAMGQSERLGDLQASWPARHPLMLNSVSGIRKEPWVMSELRFYDLWYRGKWEALLSEAYRLPFVQLAGSESSASRYTHTFDRRLAWWMGQEAKAQLANRQGRHPLQIGTDREFDNTLGDLTTALSHQEIPRAARLLLHADLPEMLVPSADDPNLFERSSSRIRQLIADSPALQAELEKTYAGIGQLRLNQARETGNTTQLKRLRMHFHDNAVGQAAALELANRALSLGQFAAAKSAYRALQSPPQDKLGLLDSFPPDPPSLAAPAPLPSDFDLHTINGLRLSRKTLAHRQDEFIGLAGFANSASRIIVNHHCLLFAIEKTRKILWQRPRKKLPRHLPPPATPVWVGRRVIVPEFDPSIERWTLIACDESDGKLSWQQPLHGDLLAGPLLLHDRLYLVLAQNERGRRRVLLHTFSPQDGGPLDFQNIAGFQPDDRLYLETAMSTWEGQIILRAANTLFAIDIEGPRWARRVPAIPRDHLRAPDMQRSQAPLVIHDSIVFNALGSGGVHCVDAQTGALRWQYVEPAARNLLDLGDNRLAVFSERGFAVIRADTGKPIAYRREHMALYALLAASDGSIVMPWLNQVNNKWDESQRRIRWFDPETGEPSARQLLAGPRHIHNFRGLWSDGRDLYGFAVQNASDKNTPIHFLQLKARP